MATEPGWDFRDAASRETLLGVLRREVDDTLALVADPGTWEAPTACEGWQVRDVVGHLVDTTEGYFTAFDAARGGPSAPEPLGLRVMAQVVDEHAKSFRKVPQGEMVDRLRDDSARMLTIFDELSDADWSGLLAPHPFMGPVPAMFYAIFQLVDYTVHAWDVREGRGAPHGIDGDAADLLVPLIYILWEATADVSGVTDVFSVGIRTSGRNGGDTVLIVTSGGVEYEEADFGSCAATIEFDPASLVLAGYARMNAGTVRGDRARASQFRSLFFPI
jgi:uncharacterized protein (TIGR03083 family)